MTTPNPTENSMPEDDLIVTAPELGEWLSLTDSSIRELARENRIPKSGRGCYPLKKSIQQYCKHIREVAAGRKSGSAEGDGGPDLVAERARLAKAQADWQEMQNDLFVGSVVLVADVATAVGNEYTTVRAALLALPSMIAPAAHRAKTVPEVEAIIRDGVDGALEALSSDPAALAPETPPKPQGRMRGPGKRRPRQPKAEPATDAQP